MTVSYETLSDHLSTGDVKSLKVKQSVMYRGISRGKTMEILPLAPDKFKYTGEKYEANMEFGSPNKFRGAGLAGVTYPDPGKPKNEKPYFTMQRFINADGFDWPLMVLGEGEGSYYGNGDKNTKKRVMNRLMSATRRSVDKHLWTKRHGSLGRISSKSTNTLTISETAIELFTDTLEHTLAVWNGDVFVNNITVAAVDPTNNTITATSAGDADATHDIFPVGSKNGATVYGCNTIPEIVDKNTWKAAVTGLTYSATTHLNQWAAGVKSSQGALNSWIIASMIGDRTRLELGEEVKSYKLCMGKEMPVVMAKLRADKADHKPGDTKGYGYEDTKEITVSGVKVEPWVHKYVPKGEIYGLAMMKDGGDVPPAIFRAHPKGYNAVRFHTEGKNGGDPFYRVGKTDEIRCDLNFFMALETFCRWPNFRITDIDYVAFGS